MTAETEERLRETLHSYKKSEIDGDELTYRACQGPVSRRCGGRPHPRFRLPRVQGTKPGKFEEHPQEPYDERVVHDARGHLEPLPASHQAFLRGPLFPARTGRGTDPPDELPFCIMRHCR